MTTLLSPEDHDKQNEPEADEKNLSTSPIDLDKITIDDLPIDWDKVISSVPGITYTHVIERKNLPAHHKRVLDEIRHLFASLPLITNIQDNEDALGVVLLDFSDDLSDIQFESIEAVLKIVTASDNWISVEVPKDGDNTQDILSAVSPVSKADIQADKDDDDDTLPLVPLNRDIILQSKHAGSILSALISLIIELPLIESVKDDPNLDAVVVRFVAPLNEEQIDNIGAVLNVVLTSEYMVAVEAPDVPMPEALRPVPDPKDVQIDALRAALDLANGTIDDLNLKVADLRTANEIYDGTINFLKDELDMAQSMNETRKLLKPRVEAVCDKGIYSGHYAARINSGWQVAAQWGDGSDLNVMWVREANEPQGERTAGANFRLTNTAPLSAFEKLLVAKEIGMPVELAYQHNGNGQSWLGLRYLNQAGR